MSFIDWSLAAQPQSPLAQQQANAAEVQNIQQQRALRALHGINVGNQASVQGGINALTGLGMTDQAKVLTDLAQTRAVNTAALPVTQAGLALAGQKIAQASQSSDQPQDDQQPDHDGAHRQILQQGADAVNDLLNYKDQPLRAAAADVYRKKFADMGIPQKNIDEVFGDLSDEGLKKHEAFLTAAAGGDASAEHPTGYAASQALLNSDPIYRNSEGQLTGPMADPLVQGVLAKYAGIDVGPGLSRAAEITAPARGQAATAAFAGTNAYATTAATNIANFNTEPAVARAVSKATAEGTQAGTTQTIHMDDGSTKYGVLDRRADGTPYMIPLEGGSPQGTAAPSGPQPGSPGIARGAGIAGTADASIKAATAFEDYSNGYKIRKANLDNLRQAASDISTGPQSPFWGGVGRFAAEYGIKTPFTPTANQAAAYDELHKMAISVAAQQSEALHLPNTNQGLDISTGATPNERNSPLGIKRLAGVLEGGEDYINATRQAWETFKSQGHTGETYNQWLRRKAG